MNRSKSLLGAALLAAAFTMSSQAVTPPKGVAPVTSPAGGFSIGGEVVAGSAGVTAGDWLAGSGNAGVLNTSGVPLNPASTFHFIDPFSSGSDNTFSSGDKWITDPNTWQWTTGKAGSKSDINNVLMHVATDNNLHTWLILAADRGSSSGSSYIDFELLQNTMTANANGTFSSAGPNGGRTANDLLLTLSFENGGSVANFLAYRWMTNSSSGGYTYVDATASLPAGKVFVALNSNTVAVPYGAFGHTTYAPMLFLEAAVDMTALMGNFDPCLSIGVKTIMVKTKSSAATSSTSSDFITPIQYSVRLGPGSDAGPDQAQCTQGASTAFALQGQATPGLFPVVSKTWSVVWGSATIDSPTSLNTIAHVSSSSATLRLTVVQGNGCSETSDILLTVNPFPSATLSGPGSVFPQTTAQFSAPAGMSSYSWSISGNGSISGPSNAQTVTVTAGNVCGSTYNLSLSVMNNGCTSSSSTNVLVSNTGLPVITVPANLTLECPADTSTGATGVATAQDNSGNLSVGYTDVLTSNCGGARVIARTWTTTNLCGYSVSAVQTITVQDTTPPTVTAPQNLTLSFVSNTSTNSTGVAAAQDGCSSVSLGYSDVVSAQADGSQVITRTWVATDACGNTANAVQSITLNAPQALVLPSQSDITATSSLTLTVTNTATDPNGSTNTLSYQLLDPPAGATIDDNGIIIWTPTPGQSPSTNTLTTVVTTTVVNSTGSTTISTTNSFVVIVTGPYDGLDMLTDSDGDGLTNLVEYAVGSDPLNPADGNDGIIIYLTQDSGNHYLTMKYRARINAAALQLQYLPEVSADKLAWYSDTNNVLQLSVSPLDSVFNWVIVRDTTPIIPAEARFIRMHVILAGQESFSPIWIGSDTLLQGNNLTLFSQRMVRPIVSAGTVSSVSFGVLNDTNAAYTASQFGTNGTPAYVEFNSGAMMDIANTSPQAVALASSVGGLASVGDAYRIRAHFTVASLFGTNNESGLIAGANPAQADNVLVYMPETQSTLTVFYYSNPSFTSWQGWVRADTLTPVADLVVYPEEGLMVRRIVASDAHVYLCGPIKVGVTLAPVQPGYNLLGTLKSLSSVKLSNLNLYTGDATTGMVGNLNPSLADNLIVIQPDGSVTTYFYYYRQGVYQGWINANGFTVADDVQIAPGSAFFINRQAPGAFTWSIPAE